MKAHTVAVQPHGRIELPAELCDRHHLDEPAAQIRIVEHEDGTIELLPLPTDQRWFWTERWQAMEREADEDIAAGRISRASGIDEFFEHLRHVSDD